MIFMKFLNLGLIITICFYLGNLKAKTYENRVLELSKFQNSLLVLKNKIEFTYEPISSVFADISKTIYENDNNIFFNVLNKNSELCIAWNEATDEIVNINMEDREIIKMFGKTLGKIDIKGQVSQIELSLKLIEKQIEKAEMEKNKNSKLYRAMGIISGMAICVILV